MPLARQKGKKMTQQYLVLQTWLRSGISLCGVLLATMSRAPLGLKYEHLPTAQGERDFRRFCYQQVFTMAELYKGEDNFEIWVLFQ